MAWCLWWWWLVCLIRYLTIESHLYSISAPAKHLANKSDACRPPPVSAKAYPHIYKAFFSSSLSAQPLCALSQQTIDNNNYSIDISAKPELDMCYLYAAVLRKANFFALPVLYQCSTTAIVSHSHRRWCKRGWALVRAHPRNYWQRDLLSIGASSLRMFSSDMSAASKR